MVSIKFDKKVKQWSLTELCAERDKGLEKLHPCFELKNSKE